MCSSCLTCGCHPLLEIHVLAVLVCEVLVNFCTFITALSMSEQGLVCRTDVTAVNVVTFLGVAGLGSTFTALIPLVVVLRVVVLRDTTSPKHCAVGGAAVAGLIFALVAYGLRSDVSDSGPCDPGVWFLLSLFCFMGGIMTLLLFALHAVLIFLEPHSHDHDHTHQHPRLELNSDSSSSLSIRSHFRSHSRSVASETDRLLPAEFV